MKYVPTGRLDKSTEVAGYMQVRPRGGSANADGRGKDVVGLRKSTVETHCGGNERNNICYYFHDYVFYR